MDLDLDYRMFALFGLMPVDETEDSIALLGSLEAIGWFRRYHGLHGLSDGAGVVNRDAEGEGFILSIHKHLIGLGGLSY